MKKHSDYITHINNKEDEIYLRSKLLPVNMRLFNSSPEYKAIILQQCEYIKQNCLETKEGYKKPHGMSAANLGLSFNIIGIVINRNTAKEDCLIMINPRIYGHGDSTITVKSNCGSVTLAHPIDVLRYERVLVKWFSIDNKQGERWFSREHGSLTIQHEVEHNLGILITDNN